MIFWVKPLSTSREADFSIHSHLQIESEMCLGHHLKSQFHFRLKDHAASTSRYNNLSINFLGKNSTVRKYFASQRDNYFDLPLQDFSLTAASFAALLLRELMKTLIMPAKIKKKELVSGN